MNMTTVLSCTSCSLGFQGLSFLGLYRPYILLVFEEASFHMWSIKRYSPKGSDAIDFAVNFSAYEYLDVST